MVSVTCHIVELNQGGFLLVVGVHLQVVLMQNDVVCSLVSEDVRVHILQQGLITFVILMVLLGSSLTLIFPSDP